MHIINRKKDIRSERKDLSPENESLQVACYLAPKGKKLTPHKHIEQIRTPGTAQESWLILNGKIKITLYDFDEGIIQETILNQGDCLITFRGGHDYFVLEEDTLIYEHKTGPYLGEGRDKVAIKKWD